MRSEVDLRSGNGTFRGQSLRSVLPSLRFLLALSFLLAACAASEPTEWCPPAGVEVDVVANSGAGAWDSVGASPRLVELWRAGGLREGEELAQPIHLVVSPTGRAAVPDFGLGEVVVIEADGRWAGARGGRGSGPGELTMPVAAAWGEAEGLTVFDIVAPKITFLAGSTLAADDQPVTPTFTAPVVNSGELHWAGVQPGGAALLQPSYLPLDDETIASGRATTASTSQRLALILRLPPGAIEPDTLIRGIIHTIPEGRPFAGWTLPGWPRPVAAVGPDGILATGGGDASYRVVFHDDEGRPTHHICRDSPALPLSPAETGRAETPDALRDLAAALRAAPAPDALAPYGRIFVDADRRLWVQRERPSPLDATDALLGVAGAHYDIFDADGRYLGELLAPPRARLQAALGDTVWAFEVGELDETEVVAYRIEGVH